MGSETDPTARETLGFGLQAANLRIPGWGSGASGLQLHEMLYSYDYGRNFGVYQAMLAQNPKPESRREHTYEMRNL